MNNGFHFHLCADILAPLQAKISLKLPMAVNDTMHIVKHGAKPIDILVSDKLEPRTINELANSKDVDRLVPNKCLLGHIRKHNQKPISYKLESF